jgi:hypothetical protein
MQAKMRLLGVHEKGGLVLVGLVGDPPLELVGIDPGAAGQIERHCLPDLVCLLLLGRSDVLGTHGGTSNGGRA